MKIKNKFEKNMIGILNKKMDTHNVVFSGYQVFQTRNPFQFIRSVYGDIKLCVVKFWSTKLLVDEVHKEYTSLVLRPIVNPDPNRVRLIIPKTEFINGEEEGWEQKVVNYIKSDRKRTLVVLEGIHWPEECRIHYERIEKINKILEDMT